MYTIQLTDDDPYVLEAIKRLFRKQDWQLQTFSNVMDALNALSHQEYAVIAADYKMPALDGITYLEFAMQRQPLATRIMLSAHSDDSSVADAVKRAEVHRFLSKPWDNQEIETVFADAVELYRLRHALDELEENCTRQRALIEGVKLRLRDSSRSRQK